MSMAIEDYLKAIYLIGRSDRAVSTSSLAERLMISPASVTEMVKKLAGKRLVRHAPYRGVTLTEKGRRMALSTLRNHRLIELFLHRVLGLSWDKVHNEAERWEHVISPEVIDLIDRHLGHPSVDPHGAPIPTADGLIEYGNCLPLSDIQPKSRVEIVRVRERDPELLRYLEKLHLVPGNKFELISFEPYGGPVTLKYKGKKISLGLEAARFIYAAVENKEESNRKSI